MIFSLLSNVRLLGKCDSDSPQALDYPSIEWQIRGKILMQ